ncbi:MULTISPECIES: flagellar basal body P-ring formation chaperone FlgA [Rhizobium]|uniref:flagellar basal body P-ring formation chaperone FlgA n=1 Tax=Rhizobium TaxID=379 RepID=UPI001B3374DB|nr:MULTISPECIES: flagellar basal body P-ring formation chaperone FlgA [Rhizobium]MBX4910171.1 flagellar basal body P-ring formation protein FlgA [Rhizobium bangladeshense]MBX5214541.1 flagellar basal body P-ring formation protein FlgA [Rhizobium sp. NLR9a]MBX5220712.1 flagellar basal body P-ring formation protein FlgA [Rhizobium sp. NLR8a]MBX5226175.1 flagellar basal body P-ring formation protein FlgA [Rhizobium sp. NLR9b]MBX5231696.1 flagellar basal body P-ring formation protein FlgA [Rhizobi
MMFCRAGRISGWVAAATIALAGVVLPADAGAGMGYAVVPTTIIYPGDTLSGSQLQEVEVTNPNLAGDYAKSISQVEGLVSKRTLLPGRTISVSALREPYTVTRGSSIRLVFSLGAMTISAAGTPLEDGATGQVVRARNMDSGVIVSGTVLADGTIHVRAK